MIRENKYFILVNISENTNEEVYFLRPKMKIGSMGKSYLFDILLGVVNDKKKISILISTFDFFSAKYIQVFGAKNEGYFQYGENFSQDDLETYRIENFVLKSNSGDGLMFTILDFFEFDVTIDSIDLIEDIQFAERFFAGLSFSASSYLTLPQKLNKENDFKSKIGSISNLRISSENFENKAPSAEVVNEMFRELQLFNSPVALAGGISPFCFIEVNFVTGTVVVNGSSERLFIPFEILDFAFMNQISEYRSKYFILICASLDTLTLKYGVRSNRFVNLEAGSISHAISLYCSEVGMRCRVIGGFDDEILSKSLRLKEKNIFPVVALFLGDLSE